MKTLNLTLLTFITASFTFSCSNDDSPAKIDPELIIGTWKWTESSKNGSTVALTACNLLDTHIFSNTQTTRISHSKGTSTTCTSDTSISTYSISDNTITEIAQSKTYTSEIVTLDSTTLIIKSDKIEGDETYVYTNTYKK